MSLAINSLVNAKPSILERTHFNPPPLQHRHGHSSKGSSKKGLALTALTLLSFLFFLNILQNCLDEHMASMNSTQQQVTIMIQARDPELRELEAQKRKGETGVNVTALSQQARIVDKTDRYTQIPVKLRTNEKAVRP